MKNFLKCNQILSGQQSSSRKANVISSGREIPGFLFIEIEVLLPYAKEPTIIPYSEPD
jgi:hypothetical protein